MSSFDKKGFFFFLKFSVALLLFVSFAILLPPVLYKAEEAPATNTYHVRKVAEKNYKATLAIVGDIMLDRGIRNKVNSLAEGDYNFVFSKIKDDLNKYDLVFGNLEGPISDKGEDIGGIYSFRMDPKVIESFKNSGKWIFSVANNHINNWGRVAMADTFFRLNNAEIPFTGGGLNEEEAYSAKTLIINGNKISFLAFSEFGRGQYEATGDSTGIAIISEEKIKESITKAKDPEGLLIVSFHFGEEYQSVQNSYQEKYARMAIDSGADMVVGHHPHVVQPIEIYNGSYILYSLGNFVFDQYFSEETMSSILVEVYIDENTIKEVKTKNVTIDKDFRPYLN